MKSFINLLEDEYNEPTGEWPEAPIVTEAKKRLAKGIKPTKLCYDLTHKELEIINYLLVGEKKDTYAVFFYGVGGSGKSTVCNLIAKLFGRQDTSYCNFHDLGNRFDIREIVGKRLWYDTDVPCFWTDSVAGTFKKITTHDTLQTEKKCADPRDSEFRAKPLFCCNIPPRFDITDSGLLRRILYYKKDKKIENPNGDFENKDWTYDELVNIAMVALGEEYKFSFKHFEEETREIIMKTNSVGKYGMNVDYDRYTELCRDSNLKAFGEDKFLEIKELFNSWL